MKTPVSFGNASMVMNPFPGLRPFEADEDHLFFGRDCQVDDLMRRLRTTRFLSVVGGSGTGKSSLVKSGLIPNLHSGYMASAGSHWRVAIFRPGESPIQNLAFALAAPSALGEEGTATTLPLRTIIEATLRSGRRGLSDAVAQAHLLETVNFLIVVDQFEELFRFQSNRNISAAREEALAFVKMLLTAASRSDISVYVCLTMRSEYIGNCMDYPGLTEAVNRGQFLVPRMNRDELRCAITGPISVCGAKITSGLLTRLLNEASEAADQLPVLQHALMRTWDLWKERTKGEGELTVEDYEATGTIKSALSRHADEAFMELSSGRQRLVAKRVFQRLTEITDDDHGVRRPATISELCQVFKATESEITVVVETFREKGRSFLMPPSGVPLSKSSVIDLSHEALMRIWERLKHWTVEEKESASLYRRLAQSAMLHTKQEESLWRNPQLRVALDWWRKQEPNAAWAERYGGSFDQVFDFLDRSYNAYRILRGSFYAVLLFAILATGWWAHHKVELAKLDTLEAQAAEKKASDKARGLQSEIDKFLIENPQLRQEAVKLRLKNRELNLRILEVEAVNMVLEQKRVSLGFEQRTLTIKQSDLKADINRLEALSKQLTNYLRDLETEYVETDKQLSLKTSEMEKLRQLNGVLRSDAIKKGYLIERVQERYASAMPVAAVPTEKMQKPQAQPFPAAFPAPSSEYLIDEMSQRLNYLEKENRRLKMTFEELSTENNKLEAKLKPLQVSNARLKKDVDELETRINTLAVENTHLEKVRRSLELSVERLRVKKTDLIARINDMNLDIHRLNGIIYSVQEENETLHEIINNPDLIKKGRNFQESQ